MAEFIELFSENIARCELIYFEAFDVPVGMRPYHRLEDYFTRFITEEGKYAVGVTQEGVIRGFLLAYDVPNQYMDKTVHISDFAVETAYQKMGLGRFMLKSFLEKYCADGQTTLLTKKELPAHKLYEEFEFEDTDYLFMSRLPDTSRLIRELEEENKRLKEEKERLLREIGNI